MTDGTGELPAFLLNGRSVLSELSASRALHYGDGVFRTLLKFDGCVLDLDAQLRKVFADAAAIGLDVSGLSVQELAADVQTAAKPMATAVVKILLVRSGPGRGYAPQTDVADRYIYVYPAPSYPESCWMEGIDTERATVTLAAQPLLAGVKHLNRLEQVLACRSSSAAAQEVILCDGNGNAICGGRSNLFVIANDVLYTPDLAQCGVRGLMREKVLAIADGLHMSTRVEALTWSRVEAADEVFVTNSLIGIWPVRGIGSRRYDSPGPLTRRLDQALAQPRLI